MKRAFLSTYRVVAPSIYYTAHRVNEAPILESPIHKAAKLIHVVPAANIVLLHTTIETATGWLIKLYLDENDAIDEQKILTFPSSRTCRQSISTPCISHLNKWFLDLCRNRHRHREFCGLPRRHGTQGNNSVSRSCCRGQVMQKDRKRWKGQRQTTWIQTRMNKGDLNSPYSCRLYDPSTPPLARENIDCKVQEPTHINSQIRRFQLTSSNCICKA